MTPAAAGEGEGGGKPQPVLIEFDANGKALNRQIQATAKTGSKPCLMVLPINSWHMSSVSQALDIERWHQASIAQVMLACHRDPTTSAAKVQVQYDVDAKRVHVVAYLPPGGE